MCDEGRIRETPYSRYQQLNAPPANMVSAAPSLSPAILQVLIQGYQPPMSVVYHSLQLAEKFFPFSRSLLQRLSRSRAVLKPDNSRFSFLELISTYTGRFIFLEHLENRAGGRRGGGGLTGSQPGRLLFHMLMSYCSIYHYLSQFPFSSSPGSVASFGPCGHPKRPKV